MAGPAAEAYIIMRADGTLLPRDVKDFAGDAGEAAAEEFSDEWDKELEGRQERSLKKFRSQINKVLDDPSLFKSLQRAGESSDQTFKRLTKTMGGLREQGLLSDKVFRQFGESFAKYKVIEEYDSKVGDLGRTMDELGNKQRKMFDRDIRAAMESYGNNWDNIAKKFDSAEEMGRALEARLREMTEANKDNGASADKVRRAYEVWADRTRRLAREQDFQKSSTGKLIQSVRDLDRVHDQLFDGEIDKAVKSLGNDWSLLAKKMGGVEETSKRLTARLQAMQDEGKATAADAKRIQEAFDGWRAEQERLIESQSKLEKSTKKVGKANSYLQRELDKTKGAAEKALDKLIVESATTKSWSDLNHHVNDAADTVDHVRTRQERLTTTTKAVTDRLNSLRESGSLTEESFRDLTDAFEEYRREQQRVIDSMSDLEVRQERARVIHLAVNRTVREGHKGRDDFIRQLGTMGDRTGRMFGKDGRNDALHFFGTLVGGITKFALQAPAKVFNVASDGVKTFRSSFEQLTKSVSDGGAGMGKVPAMFSSMGGAARAMAPAMASGAVAVIGFSAAAGALASFVSLLVGNLVILGQTLYLSVAAPLLALVPAIASFGAGALVAGGAIYKWAQQSDAFKSAVSRVSKELDRLAERITPAMDGLSRLFGEAGQSLVRSFGGAVERVMNDLYKRLDHPSMDKFYRAWGESMPRAFESLGKAATSFITGLTAFFVPILPYAERLANAIERAANRFATWAKSAEGQNAIAGWMETAWQVAVDLWTGLKDIWVALRNVFGLATDQGGNFAKWVRDIAERFKEWTESEEGRKAIKQWLDDAAELAKDLWDVITDLARAFDELDSESGREALNDFLDVFKALATAARIFSTVMNAVNTVVGPVIDYLSYGIGILASNVKDLFTLDFDGFGSTWGRVMTDAYNVAANFFGLEPADDFGDALDKSAERVKGWGSAIGEAFSDAGDAISRWFEGLDLGGKWDSAWGAVEGAISDGVSWLSEKASDVWDAIKGWFDVDWSGVWEDIKSGLSDLVERAKGWLESKGSDIADTVKGWFDIDWSGVLDSFMGFLGGMARQAGLGIGLVVGFFVKLPGRIGDGLSSAWDAISTWTSDTWDSFSTWASELPGRIEDGLSKAWDAIKTWTSDTWDAIKTWTSDTWDSIKTWASDTWDAFSTWAGEVPGRIREGLSSAWAAISSWTSDTWDSFSTWAGELPGRIADGLRSALESVKTWATDMKDAVVGWWEDIDWSGIWEGIKSGISEGVQGIWEWLKEQGKSLFDQFIQGIKDGLEIASPSGKMIELMGYVGEGILQGLLAIPGMIAGAVSGLFQPLIDKAMALPGQVVSALSTLGSTIGSTLSTVGSTISSTVSGWWSSIGSHLSGWGGKAKNALSSFGSTIGSTFDSAKTAASQKAGQLVEGARSRLSEMGGKASSALSSLGSNVKSRFDTAKSNATSTASSLVEGARSRFSQMGSKASSALSNLSGQVKSRFNTAKTNAVSTASSLVSSARSKFSQMGSKASSAMSNLASNVKSRFNSAKSSAVSVSGSLVSSARSRLSRMGSSASSAMSNLRSSVQSRFNSAKSAAVSVARSMVSSARSALSGMAGALSGALSGVTNAIKRPFELAKNAVDRILGQIRSLASRAGSIGGSLRGKIPGFAKGGTVFGNQIARVGETGAEAIVPLTRPLHQVDPSVRWLSAIAQGKSTGGGGTTIQSGAIQVVTPYANPELVANRVLDDLVANL